jgi:hypothetical protein
LEKGVTVVAKVEFRFGELFPRVGFIVTNLGLRSRAIVRFYNKRDTAEQWIKEGEQATGHESASMAPGVEPGVTKNNSGSFVSALGV